MTTVVDTMGPRVPILPLPSRCYKSVKTLCRRYGVHFSQSTGIEPVVQYFTMGFGGAKLVSGSHKRYKLGHAII